MWHVLLWIGSASANNSVTCCSQYSCSQQQEETNRHPPPHHHPHPQTKPEKNLEQFWKLEFVSRWSTPRLWGGLLVLWGCVFWDTLQQFVHSIPPLSALVPATIPHWPANFCMMGQSQIPSPHSLPHFLPNLYAFTLFPFIHLSLFHPSHSLHCISCCDFVFLLRLPV